MSQPIPRFYPCILKERLRKTEIISFKISAFNQDSDYLPNAKQE
jgi:hypothetical protein